MSSSDFLRDVKEIPPAICAQIHQGVFHDSSWSIQSFQELFALNSTFGKALWSPLEESCWGFYMAQHAADSCDLLTILVQKRQKKKGWGTFLLESFLEDARQKGVKKVFLEVAADNHAAISFYKKSGFKNIGKRPKYYRKNGNLYFDALAFFTFIR
ncbi:MAG: GNAT family N-acetyltransferase [Holosporales bacterium]